MFSISTISLSLHIHSPLEYFPIWVLDLCLARVANSVIEISLYDQSVWTSSHLENPSPLDLIISELTLVESAICKE